MTIAGGKWASPRILAWLTSAVFAALIVKEVAPVINENVAWFIADKPVPSVSANQPPMIAAAPRPSVSSGIKHVTQAYLFGQSVSVPVKPVVEDAPDTKLQLDLRGIFAGEDDSSYAIILYKNKAQQNFSLGDSVYGLGTLHSIYPDRVVLKRKTGFETLRLPVDETLLTVKRKAKPDLPKPVEVKRPPLSEFTRHVRMLPEYDEELDDDSLIGFLIISASTQGRPWMEQLGLKTGDVIVSANGTLLNTEDSIDDFDRLLITQTSVLLVVKRDDSLLKVTLK